jgi:hypothetical protein
MMALRCPGCTRLAQELKISEDEAHEIMLNSKILKDKEMLRYHMQPELTRHDLNFETVYKKIKQHKTECVYYKLL